MKMSKYYYQLNKNMKHLNIIIHSSTMLKLHKILKTNIEMLKPYIKFKK